MQLTSDFRRLGYFLLGIAVLLLIPFLAMQFTEEVNWSGGDFLMMGGLLFLFAVGIEAMLQATKQTRTRILLGLFLLVLFLLIWAELAVGIFGSPFAGS